MKELPKTETLSSCGALNTLKYVRNIQSCPTTKTTTKGVYIWHKITKKTNIHIRLHILHLLWPRTMPINPICSIYAMWHLTL